jgi:hypothetical protein
MVKGLRILGFRFFLLLYWRLCLLRGKTMEYGSFSFALTFFRIENF